MRTDPANLRWHSHTPAHFPLLHGNCFMVTCGTYRKVPHFLDEARRERLVRFLLAEANAFGWELQAWAVMSNHYHFVGMSEHPDNLARLMRTLHGKSARYANTRDHKPGRMVWYQYWDTQVRSDEEWAARMNYTMENPVKHRIVSDARLYRFCSAKRFYEEAEAELARVVSAAQTDRLDVPDFE